MSVTIDKNGLRHFHMTAETGHLLGDVKPIGLAVEQSAGPWAEQSHDLLAYTLEVIREDGGMEVVGTIVGPVLPRAGESVRTLHGGEYVVLKVLEVQHQLDKPEPPNISVVCAIVRRIVRAQTLPLEN